MMRWIFLAAIFLAAPGNAGAAIDFTPVDGERTLEGIVFKQLHFREDDRTITYEPPRGWSCHGSAASLRLVPADFSQSQATVEQSALPAPQVFDEATIGRLRQAVMGSVPEGALNVALVGEEKNPLRIRQQETFAATVSYSFYGQDYALSVLFANVGQTQLRFRTVARRADFEKVQRAFRASLFTLAWK